MEQKEMVNHPNHYKTSNGLEAIDVMEAFTEGLEGIEAVDTANMIKYILRWKKKNGAEDIRKALWYGNHLLNHLEKDQTCPTVEIKNRKGEAVGELPFGYTTGD